MKENIDLQPWLEYFDMLKRYEEKGFLEMPEEKDEAFITRAALCTIANIDKYGDRSAEGVVTDAIAEVARNIHVYAGWRKRKGKNYLHQNFAVHVVKEDAPHDLLYTLLLTRHRKWWKLWQRVDCIEPIIY